MTDEPNIPDAVVVDATAEYLGPIIRTLSNGQKETCYRSMRRAIAAAIKADRAGDARVLEERERCAKAISAKATALDHKECCGFGVYNGGPNGCPPECCGEPDLILSERDALAAILARNGGDNDQT